MMDAFHFIRPEWLLLFPIVIAIWWMVVRTEDSLRGWRQSMAPELLKALTTGQSGSRWMRNGLLLTAWCFAIVAIAGPTWKPEPSPFADDPVPAMLLMKADEGMLTEDLAPSRMARAQLEAVDLANQRKGQPLGLLAYSGSPHLVLPPTRDTSIVATMASEISPDIMPDQGQTEQGSDLSGAMLLAVKAMDEASGAIVILADQLSGGSSLAEFRQRFSNPVIVLRTVSENSPPTPETQAAVRLLNATVVEMTADETDTAQIVRAAATTPVAATRPGETTRWHEAGYWLCPVLLVICLASFRRVSAIADEVNGESHP